MRSDHTHGTNGFTEWLAAYHEKPFGLRSGHLIIPSPHSWPGMSGRCFRGAFWTNWTNIIEMKHDQGGEMS